MTPTPARTAAAYAVALVAPLAALLSRLVLRPAIGDDAQVPFVTFFLAVSLAAWYGGLGPGVMATGVSAVLANAYLFAPRHTLSIQDPVQVTQLLLFLAVGLSISLIAHGQARAREEAAEQAERARRAEAEATRREREYRKRAEHEHRIAESLQRALLIEEPPARRFPGIALATIYRPASDEAHVGGDFYDFFALDGGLVALVVGDVAGKGLAAAMQTAEVRFTLRSVLREMGGATQGRARGGDLLPEAGEALRRTNAVLCAAYRLERREPTPGFVCLALVVLDPAGGRGVCACAGLEPPLMVREGGDAAGTPEVMDAAGPPLGVVEAAEYPTTGFAIGEAGDTLLMMTDGLTEARRDARAFFGPEGVARAAREALAAGTGDASEEALARAGALVVAAATEYSGEGRLRDDVCLLLVQRTAPIGGVAATSPPVITAALV